MGIGRRITAVACFAFGAVLAGGTAAQAQTIKWDMAEAFAPTALPSLAAADFARLVKEKSGGRIEITVHYNGSLGIGEKDILTSVEQGVVPLSSTMLDKVQATMPPASVQFIPFMAGNLKDARALWGAARPLNEAHFAKLNQVLLFESFGPPVGVWSKKPVQSLVDLKALKLRTNHPTNTKAFQIAGASPTFMAWSDVPAALSTGVIDSVVTSCESGISAKFQEQLKYFTRLDIEIGIFMVHMHKPTLDKLPPDLRKAVLDAAAESAKRAYERTVARLDENTRTMKAAGVHVADTIPAEFRAQLNKAGATLLTDWKRKVGAENAEKVLADFGQRRKS
jgi:TRAP-type C4-dicarboxylate transport system substrate-binding protein